LDNHNQYELPEPVLIIEAKYSVLDFVTGKEEAKLQNDEVTSK